MTALFLILIVLAVIVVGGLLYLYSLPADYKVSRSQTMNVSAEKIFNRVLDFHSWGEWSPWLMHEPTAELKFGDEVKVTEVGGFYTWNGKAIGSGKLTHTGIKKEKPDRLEQKIEQKIEFRKPFRSVCKVEWTFATTQKGGAEVTEVSWSMQGRMPFLFRFMTKKMDGMIGMDYEMGLLMLNRLLDDRADRFELDFTGKVTRTEGIAAYEACGGSISALAVTMKQAFDKVFEILKQRNIRPIGPAFAAYHKVNMKKMHCTYDCAIPVGESVGDTPYTKNYPGGEYFKIRYRGSYDYMKHAWHAAMSHVRMNKYKWDGSRPSLEVYEKDMTKADTPNDYVTDIYVPIK